LQRRSEALGPNDAAALAMLGVARPMTLLAAIRNRS